MKKRVTKLLASLLVLAIVGTGGCTPSPEAELSPTPSSETSPVVIPPAEPAATPETPKTATIIDENGNVVTGVPCPPERIASLNPSVTEALYALGAGDRIICRTSDALFPPEVQQKPDVGSARSINLEALLEMGPDVVILRTRTDQDMVDKIKAAGIPVLLFWSIDMTEILPMITQMGIMLDKEESAAEFKGYIEDYLAQIDSVVTTLSQNEKPTVFYQTMGKMYTTTAGESSGNKRLIRAGAINIAGDIEGSKAPTVSPEFVVEQNPEIIVHSFSVKEIWAPSEESIHAKYDEVMTLPELQIITAITGGNVHILANRLVTGPRTIIGLLYYVKWFHPDKFTELDPAAVHADMCRKFWNVELEGTWTYPE